MALYNEIVQAVNIASKQTPVYNPIVHSNEHWMSNIFAFTDAGPQGIFSGYDSYEQRFLRSQDILRQSALYSKDNLMLATPNGNYIAGQFLTPTVEEIMAAVKMYVPAQGQAQVSIIQGKDVGKAIAEARNHEIFQVASQMNALEMISPDVQPLDGIENYIRDNTQGPRASLACAPGTFVRNYWYPATYGQQFNALSNYKLACLNGYFIWGTDPSVGKALSQNNQQMRIPAMIATQVAGVTKQGSTLVPHVHNTVVSQIFSSAVPVNTYRNGGDYQQQLNIARAVLQAQYAGTLGLALLIGAATKTAPVVNLTLVGGGVFKNPLSEILSIMRAEIAKVSAYNITIKIHGYSAAEAQAISQALQ